MQILAYNVVQDRYGNNWTKIKYGSLFWRNIILETSRFTNLTKRRWFNKRKCQPDAAKPLKRATAA